MVRKSNTNGSSDSLHFKNKRKLFKRPQSRTPIVEGKSVLKSGKGINAAKHVRRKKKNTTKENNSKSKHNTFEFGENKSSDSEPDAFSQLVSCFTDSSKTSAILSEEKFDSSEEETTKLDSTSVISLKHANNAIGLCNEEGLVSTSESEDYVEEFYPSIKICPEDEEVSLSSVPDPFEEHIQYDLDDDLYKAVSSVPQTTENVIKDWPILGQLKVVIPKPSYNSSELKKNVRIDNDVLYAKSGKVPLRLEGVSKKCLEKLHIKSQIWENILKANCKFVNEYLTSEDQFTPLQKELFSILNNYQDLYYPERTLDNAEEVKFVYCLHIVNHILKTRLKVIHHNARLSNKDLKDDVPDEFRDQGLIRPKVLILLPFRSSAIKVVEMLSAILLEEGNNNILNKKRFYEEFNAGEIAMPYKNPKPEDYERTFIGDTDDNFKIGISVTKKSLKLYADFYSADIIIASPLGLRVTIGAEGQADRDFDFLASIELLIVDQAEIILMQNWDHLLHIWDHLHMQPRQSHGTNFARVRSWALNGRACYYRQTLLYSGHALPQISALFSRKCHNYAGKVWVVNPIMTGTICQIVLQLPQVFNRIECNSPTDSIDARFEHFVSKVLPQYKESMMNHTLIYVPSYFDYVRIRNYFKKETVSFVQICEYSKDEKIARARDMFFHEGAHFLLYSERFHFFRRIRLKGIRHIVFYQPPTIPHFYSEMCNLMQSEKQAEEGSLSVSVLYTRYDAAQLAAIVGSERAARMLGSDRTVHMFMTGE